MRRSGQTGCTGARAGAIAVVIVLAAFVGLCPAESPPQPVVTLPPADILSSGAAGLGTRPAAGRESSQEIRRAGEPARRASENETNSAGLPAGTEDGRLVSRQGPARGLWRASDFLPLAIVLALVLLAAWAVKRYLPARRLVTGSGVLEIVGRLPLSPKQSLVLIKMGRRMVLVGVSPERVSTVCLVDDPEQVAELVGRIAAQSRESSAPAFGRSLDRQAAAFEKGDDEDASERAGGGVRGLLEKVRRLSRSGVS